MYVVVIYWSIEQLSFESLAELSMFRVFLVHYLDPIVYRKLTTLEFKHSHWLIKVM